MKKKVLAIATLTAAVAVFAIAMTRASGTIAAAQKKGQDAGRIIESGRELGLTCFSQPAQCAEMIARADKNPQLKEAFLGVKSAGVSILPMEWMFLGFSTGRVGEGYISINTSASDKRIIAFLTN
jgi:hypothetical protein